MELRHLKYFMAVADELHFKKAAQKLYIAQPPLSRQIKNLEDELGVELLKRNKKKVELTQYGIYLKGEAVKIFQQVEAIKNHLELLKKGTVGQIKIGYVGTVMHSLLPEVLKAIKKKFPEINTRLFELNNQEQVAALRSGEIDIGFIRMPMNIFDLEEKQIFKETFSLIIPKDHPAAGKSAFPISELKDEPFVVFSRDCAPEMFDTIIGICKKEGFAPRIVHESSQINSILRLVESGLGYSIVPSGVRNGYKVNVRFYELSKHKERAKLSLVYNPRHINNTSEMIINMIKSLSLE